MTISLLFYLDAGLTTPATALAAIQDTDGSAAPEDRTLYLGSTAAGRQFRAVSNPGVDPVVLSIADAASGSGVQPTHVKLATTAGGLASALAGQPLSLGTQLLSGVANAVEIHVRIDTPALSVGVYNDVSLALSNLLEEAV